MHPSIAHSGILLKPEFALDLTEKPLKILMYPQEVSTRCPQKIFFWSILVQKTLKYFILNETWYVSVFKKALSEFDDFLLKFPNYLFWAKFVPKLKSALFEMKLSTQGNSRVLILNLAIFFSYSVFETSFLGKFVSKPKSALF